ncbi:hypothetical protein DPEC_G00340010 [Dallia pectoralis]|uniref:Uncharacterized protein n=1 Tax=Dallia pectoralis TaxID=75939 RepID=A0ACC2F572_DALPE|nr:hypothetical protein DPEC_G00340010 [Dallia pectoralis]
MEADVFHAPGLLFPCKCEELRGARGQNSRRLSGSKACRRPTHQKEFDERDESIKPLAQNAADARLRYNVGGAWPICAGISGHNWDSAGRGGD